MKIISGSLKGRRVRGYQIDGTRPTMDRVKESLFAMIQDQISGAVVLDLFAGSGNLGFEAISNGASFCYFVDSNPISTKTILKTGEDFSVFDQMKVLTMDYQKALSSFSRDHTVFDLVFLDPPYRDCVILSILEYLRDKHLLRSGATIVCEMEENDIGNMDIPCYIRKNEKNYGRKRVVIYQYQQAGK